MWVAIIGVGGLVLFQLIPAVVARRARGLRVPELEPFLNTEQKLAKRLLVYFWSPTCAVCRPMSKAIEALGSAEVVRVNVVDVTALARAFHVMGTPSLAVVEGGVLKDLQVGVRSAAQLRELLQSST